MVWRLTGAGAQELAHPAVLSGTGTRRDLLASIDGVASAETILAAVSGAHPDDLHALATLGLIAVGGLAPQARRTDSWQAAGETSVPGLSGAPAMRRPSSLAIDAPKPRVDAGALAGAVRQLVAAELGIRGFPVALAIEKTGDVDELRTIAQRALDQIRARRGECAAAAARQTLFGT